MAILIDTSVFIGLERRGLNPRAFILLAPPQDAAMSAVTASELLVGVHRTGDVQRQAIRRAFVEGLLDLIPIFPFGLETARVHARLSALLTARGQITGLHDLMIAATALINGYSILTDNRRDFARVPNLTVYEPTWERAN